MQKFNVVISDEASEDLFGIVDYLNNFSSAIGEKYYNEIDKKINSLEIMPKRCPLVYDEVLRAKGYRWLPVRNYTIFFVVDEYNNIVIVHAIVYSGREYTALL